MAVAEMKRGGALTEMAFALKGRLSMSDKRAAIGELGGLLSLCSESHPRGCEECWVQGHCDNLYANLTECLPDDEFNERTEEIKDLITRHKEVKVKLEEHIQVKPDTLVVTTETPDKLTTLPEFQGKKESDDAFYSMIPPKPKAPQNVAKYYDANHAEIEADIKKLGKKAAREKWGISGTAWVHIKQRWGLSKPVAKMTEKLTTEDLTEDEIKEISGKLSERNSKIFCADVTGFSIYVKLSSGAGSIKLDYERKMMDKSLSAADRKFFMEIFHLIFEE
jgi:hypothetical protein